MRTSPTILRIPGRPEADAVKAAADALLGGKLVILPTETVYGVAARADQAASVERIRDRAGLSGRPMTWHVADRATALEHVAIDSRAHARLLRRFLPGPVRFEIEQEAESLEKLRRALRVAPGVIDDGEAVFVRVPGLGLLRRVLGVTGRPVVMVRAASFGWGAGNREREDQRIGDIEDPDIACIVDSGPTKHGLPSTSVRLLRSGGFRVVRGGAITDQELMNAVERVILFVCTGNTCRSPMAEAIARSMLDADDLTVVVSAGVATADGIPPAEEAEQVMKEEGLDISSHRTRQLTRDLVHRAAVIYTMTDAHRERVLELDRGAEGKVLPLDPAGAIPDPVGMPLESYRETAKRLREMISRRLKELDA